MRFYALLTGLVLSAFGVLAQSGAGFGSISGTVVDAAGTAVGPGGIPLARPNRPVKLPVFQDPIKSGLEPEKGGVFNIFNASDIQQVNLSYSPTSNWPQPTVTLDARSAQFSVQLDF